MSIVVIKPLTADQVELAHELEMSGYPADQAASLEAFRYRQAEFPRFFLSAWQEEKMVGLVCGVRTDAEDCSDVGMKSLYGGRADGRSFCVLSVAVHPDYRGRSIGAELLTQCVSVAEKEGLHSVMLMCQEPLVAWYEARGFRATGAVHDEHGGVEWHEMVRRLRT